jgi:hypothetical protein
MRGRRVERSLGEQMARYNGQRGWRNREAMANLEWGWTGAATEGPPLPGDRHGGKDGIPVWAVRCADDGMSPDAALVGTDATEGPSLPGERCGASMRWQQGNGMAHPWAGSMDGGQHRWGAGPGWDWLERMRYHPEGDAGRPVGDALPQNMRIFRQHMNFSYIHIDIYEVQ